MSCLPVNTVLLAEEAKRPKFCEYSFNFYKNLDECSEDPCGVEYGMNCWSTIVNETKEGNFGGLFDLLLSF